MCRHAPVTCEFPLAAGAEEADLQTVEEELGLRLPTDFRASYRRHNGSNRVSLFGLFGLGYWMPLFRPVQLKPLFRSVTDEWQTMTSYLRERLWAELGARSRPRGPIRRRHWHPAWVPFTCDDSGDFLCLDLDPPAGGKKGQVIFWWHEYGPFTVVADSFGSLITRLAERLEGGVYAFNESEELYPTQSVVRNFDQLLKVFKKGIA
jgi:cell wall assembly regulator SMI1